MLRRTTNNKNILEEKTDNKYLLEIRKKYETRISNYNQKMPLNEEFEFFYDFLKREIIIRQKLVNLE